MLNINNKNLCSNCFSEINIDNLSCPECGYYENQESQYPIALPIGTILLGRYIIGKVLGKGGFGVTYLSYDSKDNKKVAIKEYLPDTLIYRAPQDTIVSTYLGEKEDAFKKGSERFYEEAQTISKFNGHPNIVSVYEFFYENNTAYFVMEYLNGIDLKTYVLQNDGKLTEHQVMDIILPLIDALIIVHCVGVLHRDISPDNIYITKDNKIKLLDFGAARQVLGEQSKSLSIILKQGFAPIEQYQTRGKQGPWSDIYALGATIYYCLTGSIPEASMDRIDNDNLEFPQSVSENLKTILSKMLSVRAVNRYQSVVELRNDLHLNNEVLINITQSNPVKKESKILNVKNKITTFIRNNKKLLTISSFACLIVIITVIAIGAFSKTNFFFPDTDSIGQINKEVVATDTESSTSKLESNIATQSQSSNKTGNNTSKNDISKSENQTQNESQSSSSKDTSSATVSTSVNSTTTNKEPENTNISVQTISLSKTTGKMNVGEQMTLTANISPSDSTNKQVNWTSNNTTVASVTNGQINAKSEGTAVVTVETVDGNKACSCTITITSPIIKVSNQTYTITTNLYTVIGNYTGDWKNDKPNGNGKFTVTEAVPSKWDIGDILTGIWTNGFMNGYGEYNGVSGYSYKGGFKNGLKHGSGAWYYNGQLEEQVTYKDGIEVG